MANIFACLVRNEITFNQFHRISSAIDIAFMGDIAQLLNLPIVELYGKNSDFMTELVRTGLAEYKISGIEGDFGFADSPRKININTDVIVSDLGKLLQSIITNTSQ